MNSEITTNISLDQILTAAIQNKATTIEVVRKKHRPITVTYYRFGIVRHSHELDSMDSIVRAFSFSGDGKNAEAELKGTLGEISLIVRAVKFSQFLSENIVIKVIQQTLGSRVYSLNDLGYNAFEQHFFGTI
jgi:hypothetical protein